MWVRKLTAIIGENFAQQNCNMINQFHSDAKLPFVMWHALANCIDFATLLSFSQSLAYLAVAPFLFFQASSGNSQTKGFKKLPILTNLHRLRFLQIFLLSAC